MSRSYCHAFGFIERGRHNRACIGESFLAIEKKTGYDFVFVGTSLDEFHPDVLDEAGHHTVMQAWNSDDDWRWALYSSQSWSHCYMVTACRHIDEQDVAARRNFLLSHVRTRRHERLPAQIGLPT